MKRALVITLFFAYTVFAQEQPDPNLEMLANDLHAVGRVAAVAENLNQSRQVLLAIVDNDIRTLRQPREDDTYRWASLQREEGGRVTDEKTIEHVHTQPELRYVTLTGANGYRVEVSAPRKRGTFAANNRVWVRNVIADITGFDGKVTHHEIPVNAWVNPGDANGVPLPDIGKSVKATVELGVESGEKQAVAQVALLQAKLVDDPNSPYFPAVQRLLQIRELAAARDINRGNLRTAVDEARLSLPGELEKRTAEQQEAARVRRQMAESGMTTGSIAIGDATPDVVNELAEISRMLSGTLQEQTDARARLANLIGTLKPASP
ncbi:MAG TPA: hypothetical protein VEK11_08260 [Thermoanaerobaculia bacterium]|nr:hypothetical protein [Thermoanaerobaculia bacterium]